MQEGECWVHFKMLKLVWSLPGVLCNWSSSQFSHAHPNKGWFLCVRTEKVTEVRSGCIWLCSLFLVAVLRMCEATTAELWQRVVQNSCHFCKIAVWGDEFGWAFWMFWTSTDMIVTGVFYSVFANQTHFFGFVCSALFDRKFMDYRWRSSTKENLSRQLLTKSI